MSNDGIAIEAVQETATVTVAQAITRALLRHGLNPVFGIPGGPLMPLTEAMSHEPALRQVLARHEAGAALMADGCHRATGRMCAVAVTAGPGTTNLVTALALAQREHVPMLVIAAQVSTASYGLGAAQELDTVGILQTVTKRTVGLTNPERVVDLMDDLVRIAQAPRCGPVAMVVPTDLFRRPVSESALRALSQPVPPVETRYFDARQTHELAKLLAAAERPVVLAGRGSVLSGAGAELRELAVRLRHLRVTATPRAKSIFPEDDPQYAGVLGLGGHLTAEAAALEESDLLIVLGSRLGEISSGGWDPRFLSRRIVQVDVDATEPGRVFPIALGVVGDIRAVLRAVLDELPVRSTPVTPRTTSLMTEPVIERTSPVHPRALMAAIERTFPQRGHVFVDIGNSMAWSTHFLRRTQPGRFHVNLCFGSMGHSLPAAVGASFHSRDPILAIAGDAAFLMSCMELATAAQERRKLTAICADDGGHGMVEVGRKILFGRAPILPALFEPRPDIVAIGRAIGLAAFSVNDAADLEPVLLEALNDPRPALVNVQIDRTAWPPMGARMRTLLEAYSGAANGTANAGAANGAAKNGGRPC